MSTPSNAKDRMAALLTLRSVDFFDGMSAEELTVIATISNEQTHRAGDVVFEQGSSGDQLYIISEGSVEVRIDGKPVATLKSGTCFGEMAVLDRETRSAKIVVLEDSTTLVTLGRDDLFDLLELYPAVARTIAMTLVGRLRASAG